VADDVADPGLLAELAARLDGNEPGDGVSPALLAAYFDSGLDEATRSSVAQLLASSPAAFQDALAALDRLDFLAAETVPRDLLESALAGLSPKVTVLRARAPTPPAETFLPLAAASDTESKAVLCRSQSGIWTLEIFVAAGDASRGFLLLSVHPDHRATYEGRKARVFVKRGDDEHVLAEETVHEGEIYAAISLVDLDLHARDAVNVTFGPLLS
jgi:anti-sigma factor RsiW